MTELRPDALASINKLAAPGGFVGLALDGLDIQAAIDNEIDVRRLCEAFEIAKNAYEPVWSERLARRLNALAPSSESRLRLASTVIFSGGRDEARQLIDAVTAPEDVPLYRRLSAVLLAMTGAPILSSICRSRRSCGRWRSLARRCAR